MRPRLIWMKHCIICVLGLYWQHLELGLHIWLSRRMEFAKPANSVNISWAPRSAHVSSQDFILYLLLALYPSTCLRIFGVSCLGCKSLQLVLGLTTSRLPSRHPENILLSHDLGTGILYYSAIIPWLRQHISAQDSIQSPSMANLNPCICKNPGMDIALWWDNEEDMGECSLQSFTC